MSERPGRAASVRRYVFYNEHRPSRAWMPTLEIVNDRFSQYLRTALLQHLRPGIEVTPPIAIQLIKHGELIERLGAPNYLSVVTLKPLRGTMLIVVDAQLVSWVVESRFGGDGRFPLSVSSREFSPFEQKSTRRVVETALEQFALAWKPIGAFEPRIARHEISLQFAGIATASELVIVSAFDVKVGLGGGKLTICIPYAMLEPLHERLMAGFVKEATDHDLRWRETLAVGVAQATMMLNVELAQFEITVRELLALRPGNVFEIARPQSVTVEANGLPLFRGRWGKYGHKIGIRVEEQLLPMADERTVERSEARWAGGDDQR